MLAMAPDYDHLPLVNKVRFFFFSENPPRRFFFLSPRAL
jgi:hypothetical protein